MDDQTIVCLRILMCFLHEMLGPGVNVGSYPFPFEIKFSLVSMRKPMFLVARDQTSIPGVNRVLSSKKLRMLFCLLKKILPETHLFFSIV